MNNDGSKQLPPQGDGRENEVGSLLAAASDFARSVLESVQTLAGTTACKGVQIARLKDWAIQHDFWIDKNSLGTYSDRGSENEVYASLDSKHVCKLNDFRYSDDNLSPFFERITVHNQLFPDCGYDFLGFAENRDERSAPCSVSHSSTHNVKPLSRKSTKNLFDSVSIKNWTVILPMATTTSSTPYPTTS